MNPDENNTNQEGVVPAEPSVAPEMPPTPPTAPETPPEVPSVPEAPISPEAVPAPEAPAPEAPNLDQVTADLVNAGPADVASDATLAAASAPETPVAPEYPVAPVTPEPPAAPEIPTGAPAAVTPSAELSSESAPAAPAPFEPTPETPAVTATPDASVAPESPALETPVAPEPPATPEMPTEAPAPETPSETTSTDFTTGANFVNDASDGQSAEASVTNPEDEAPLVPAEPVPGSIGSALAYSDTAPNHAVPVGKPSRFKLSFGKKSQVPAGTEAPVAGVAKPGRKPLSKENLKLLIAIVGGVTLVAVVAVIIFFILNSGSKSSTTKPADNSNNNTPTNTVSSLTCTRSGDATVFSDYSSVVSGNEQIIAMYSNDILSSFGSTLKLTFADEEAAKAAQLVERDSYSAMVRSAGLTDDPFTSSYDTNGITMTVTHQAEGEDIDSKTARILGFYVVKGEPVTDIDTLLDTYETDGYTCVEK